MTGSYRPTDNMWAHSETATLGKIFFFLGGGGEQENFLGEM